MPIYSSGNTTTLIVISYETKLFEVANECEGRMSGLTFHTAGCIVFLAE